MERMFRSYRREFKNVARGRATPRDDSIARSENTRVLCINTSDETFKPLYTMGAGECKSWLISDGEKLFNSEQVDYVQRYESYLVVSI